MTNYLRTDNLYSKKSCILCHIINICGGDVEKGEMMQYIDEKMSRYRALFGLSHEFTKEELTRAYRTLAKLNHPDINADAASQMRMVIINDGYECLTAITEKEEIPSFSMKIEDPAYDLYKMGFESLSRAFELYYTDGARVRSEKLTNFLDELRSAKAVLARVIREYPASSWTGDAIDKVMSINLWLNE